eukprot:TRINITY_DN9070_c0_g1_i5.p1 TRINITY_DN9070_c0_g1~~TRINITY_DN9070_c0_g1_i5.p1  ORF type:complete len:243 (+),score=12.22 TRINITY_DN9070_c0_g1_i5:311-1039(+)
MTIQLSNSKGPCIAGHTSHLDLASNQMFFIGGFSQHFRSSQLLQVYQFKPFAFKAVFGLGSNWLGCSVIHNDIIHIFNGAVSLPYVQFSISTSLQQYPKVFYPEYGARKDKEYFLGQCASLINVGGAPCVLFFGGQSGRAGETTNKLYGFLVRFFFSLTGIEGHYSIWKRYTLHHRWPKGIFHLQDIVTHLTTDRKTILSLFLVDGAPVRKHFTTICTVLILTRGHGTKSNNGEMYLPFDVR